MLDIQVFGAADMVRSRSVRISGIPKLRDSSNGSITRVR